MIEYTEGFKIAHSKWIQDKGDQTHRLNYDLNENSIVLDIGGFKGEWSQSIFDLYGCNIYIFEPVKKYYNEIKNKFDSNEKIRVFNFGLGGSTRKETINSNGDSSNIYSANGSEEILIKNILETIDELNLDRIDLCKQNIEGGEYELMSVLGKSDKIKTINHLQIQFHKMTEIKNCVEMRENIKNELLKTHDIDYSYDWVWEGFSLKK